MEGAEIKYSTLQNWYPGDKSKGRGPVVRGTGPRVRPPKAQGSRKPLRLFAPKPKKG